MSTFRYLALLRKHSGRVGRALEELGRSHAWLHYERQKCENFRDLEREVKEQSRSHELPPCHGAVLPWVQEAVELRREGWLYAEIARLVGVSRQRVHQAIRHATQPPTDRQIKLAQAYRIVRGFESGDVEPSDIRWLRRLHKITLDGKPITRGGWDDCDE